MENVGGFKTAEFPLDGDVLLIGENNSGKTSVLRILDWLFNSLDSDLLRGRRELNEVEEALLLPARATQNKARRIFLRVRLSDGRSATKFAAKADNVAEVRVQFRASKYYARLGSPTRNEEAETEPNAAVLLDRLQGCYSCLYVPASRDGSSEIFSRILRDALRQELSGAMIYDGVGRPAGAPKATSDAAATLSTHANTFASKVWKETKENLRGGFDPKGLFSASVSAEDLVELVLDRMEARFSTGDHDAKTVAIESLGAGLQSALAIAVAQRPRSEKMYRLLLLEEPEAFLHPSAQRTIAQQTFHLPGIQTIATTHSALVLAEAAPEDIVVMRDHVAYPAASVSTTQEQKDAYLLSSLASNTMFDRSLLLVEGPGEVAYFEMLRREMRNIIPLPLLNRMRVCAVGGKAGFGPWLRLLRRFANNGDQAFEVIVCADSIDAGTDVVRALRESSVVVPAALASEIANLANGIDMSNVSPADALVIAERTSAANRLAASSNVPLHFNRVDLEYAILEALNDRRSREFAKTHGLEVESRDKLMARMGSKGGDGKASEKAGSKAPYLRANLAYIVTWDEISPDIKELLWRWVRGAMEPYSSLARPPEIS
ncbi:ATP-dependent nuclease [Leifsonia aquatica]|uniref:ATP-dependent nuclease n=1 Tax=Leifsonia aquatica TaxID=144185 RepID=UPI001B7F8799|nr:ATP-binding protein [Leifsonia aquatica]